MFRCFVKFHTHCFFPSGRLFHTTSSQWSLFAVPIPQRSKLSVKRPSPFLLTDFQQPFRSRKKLSLSGEESSKIGDFSRLFVPGILFNWITGGNKQYQIRTNILTFRDTFKFYADDIVLVRCLE